MITYYAEQEFLDKSVLKGPNPPYITGKTEKQKIILNEEFYDKFDLQCYEYEVFAAKS